MFCTKTAIAHFNSRRRLQTTLCDSLNEMRSDGKYCDLDLVVDGLVLPVHKNILAASSPYFDTMLSNNFLENNNSSVDLSGVFENTETLKEILNYLYTGKITLHEENLRDILNGASHFLLEDLLDSCSHYMFVNLLPVNALQQWALGDMYNLRVLADLCRQVVRTRFHDVLIYREEPVHIPPRFLEEVIQQGGMDFLFTIERIRYLLNWVAVEPEIRTPILQSLLEDPDTSHKLEIHTPPAVRDGESQSNVIEHLQALLDDPRFKPPQLEEVNEALVGCHYKPKSNQDIRVLTMCAYVPSTNRWYTLTKLKVNRQFGMLIGFIRRQALFKSLHGFLVVSLNDHTFERISLPTLQRTSGIRSHSIFIFEDKVFCIMEISKYVKRSLPNGSAFLYPEARGFVKVYNFETQQWAKVCDIPVPKQIAWLPMQYHVIPRSDYSCCFIIAMSLVNSFQIRGPADQWRINGPYLLMVKKRRTKYTVLRLTDPPIDREHISDVYKTLRFVGKGNNLYLYGAVADGNQNSENCQGVLEYNIDRGRWRVIGAKSLTFPQEASNPVRGVPSARLKIGAETVGGIQSFTSGKVYQLNVPCPFVSQFWAADIETEEVQELTPPPSEKLQEFCVCNLPFAVLDGASGHYTQRFEKKHKNPMAHGYLQPHNKLWSCTFQSNEASSPRSPESSGVSDSSDQEIDVVN